jgi:hypothetical protein
MAKSLIELHREQGRLLERIAGQRRALQLQLQPLVQLNGTGEQLRAQAVRALALARQHATAGRTLALNARTTKFYVRR